MPPSTSYTLDRWQKRQAAMLYHFASDDYLKPVLSMVNALLGEADAMLDQATAEGRDRYLADPKWGVRDTSANWSTHAYQFLVQFRNNIAWLIAQRAAEVYGGSGFSQAARALQEFSMNWSTVREEERFLRTFENIGRYCQPMDMTLERDMGWDDCAFALRWQALGPGERRIPHLRIRADIRAKSGSPPPRTGVYAPLNDPYGALQFAWTGMSAGTFGGVTRAIAYGRLMDCTTFNPLGEAAARALGRENMWFDQGGVYDFIMHGQPDNSLREQLKVGGETMPEMALGVLMQEVFTRVPREWYFVERIEGEYEDEHAAPPALDRLRGEPGTRVPRSGWWYTPSIRGEQGFRYFEEGSRFPDTAHTEWGAVFWQFDPERQPK
jgi:hypothetical protein